MFDRRVANPILSHSIGDGLHNPCLVMLGTTTAIMFRTSSYYNCLLSDWLKRRSSGHHVLSYRQAAETNPTSCFVPLTLFHQCKYLAPRMCRFAPNMAWPVLFVEQTKKQRTTENHRTLFWVRATLRDIIQGKFLTTFWEHCDFTFTSRLRWEWWH